MAKYTYKEVDFPCCFSPTGQHKVTFVLKPKLYLDATEPTNYVGLRYIKYPCDPGTSLFPDSCRGYGAQFLLKLKHESWVSPVISEAGEELKKLQMGREIILDLRESNPRINWKVETPRFTDTIHGTTRALNEACSRIQAYLNVSKPVSVRRMFEFYSAGKESSWGNIKFTGYKFSSEDVFFTSEKLLNNPQFYNSMRSCMKGRLNKDLRDSYTKAIALLFTSRGLRMYNQMTVKQFVELAIVGTSGPRPFGEVEIE